MIVDNDDAAGGHRPNALTLTIRGAFNLSIKAKQGSHRFGCLRHIEG
ncbi:hypothetical protein [Devosia sp. DBB001]|nr:hypothetical protein [Devosia sp. DBB001]